MTLDIREFVWRFLLHILPRGFHRIRHYGLLATSTRAENVERARELLGALDLSSEAPNDAGTDNGADLPRCPCCGARLRIIERFQRGETPTHAPSPHQFIFRFDSS